MLECCHVGAHPFHGEQGESQNCVDGIMVASRLVGEATGSSEHLACNLVGLPTCVYERERVFRAPTRLARRPTMTSATENASCARTAAGVAARGLCHLAAAATIASSCDVCESGACTTIGTALRRVCAGGGLSSVSASVPGLGRTSGGRMACAFAEHLRAICGALLMTRHRRGPGGGVGLRSLAPWRQIGSSMAAVPDLALSWSGRCMLRWECPGRALCALCGLTSTSAVALER